MRFIFIKCKRKERQKIGWLNRDQKIKKIEYV